ncbi:M48 family metallopeptidase [Roseateles sp.]|uniref:M48 family metallopeptidase n=1 Tax=Roseateles sp. TaxID=1971397 RepID=UPI0039E80437
MNTSASPTLAAQWFDGLHPVPHPATVWFDAERVCVQAGDAAPRDYAAAKLHWPDPLRQGQRQILLPDGGVLACTDAAAYDAWLQQSGRRHAFIPRWQQSGWLALLTLVLLIATLFAGWRWGVPVAADTTVKFLPDAVDDRVGAQVLKELDRHWLRPSQLSWAQRRAVFDRFADAVDTALDRRALPKLTHFDLQFREGGRHFGPNALALPGGTIIVTDELVKLLADQPEAIVGVLGHELGHVKHRHGMRLTLRASAVGLATGVLIGDFSVALAGAPALLAQQSYSRDFERDADDYARTLLRGAGINPAVMVHFFERLEKDHSEDASNSAFAAAFSSHPADEERKAFFKK